MSDHESHLHQQRRQESQRLIAGLRVGQISRRDFVVRAGMLGFSGAVINLFLAACSTGPAATPAPTPAASNAPAPATTVSATTIPPAPQPIPPSATPSSAATPPTATVVAGPPTRPAAPATPATPAASGPPFGIATERGTLLGGPLPSNAQLADKQVLNYPLLEVNHPDPGLMTSVFEVQFGLACWDTLVTPNQAGDPQPAHATKYDIATDGLKYTFTLRPGLKFSDGSPLTAKDYEWTWKRNLDPALASEFASALYPIKGAEEYNTGKSKDPATVGVKASSDTVLEVTLAAPAPYFLALVATWMYFPLQRATIEKNKERWTEPAHIVTAGRFKVQSWEHEKHLVLVADANYYGEKPSLAQLNFVIYRDLAASSLAAYEKGDLDVVTSLTPEDLARVKKDAQLSQELNQVPSSGTSFIVFDVTNGASAVSKKAFRQAVNQAINRDRLCNEVLGGQFLPTATFAPKGILGHLDQPPTPVNLKGDVVKARTLLQQAGYAGEEIVCTHTDQPSATTVARALQADLKGAGINVRLEVLERKVFTTWREGRKTQPFGFYIGGWFSDYEDPNNWYNAFWGDPDREYWHDHYSQSPGGKTFAELIRKANLEADRKKREETYVQAERMLLDDLPVVPLYTFLDMVLVKPYVKGLVHTNVGQDLFGGVKMLKR